MFVPVVDSDQRPLMPTTPSRAKRWMRSGRATGFFKKGVFCVRLNYAPSDNKKQDIVVGIDPGSKKEGFTVKSECHTYLNLQADAVIWVKGAMERRKAARMGRRNRNTPCREPRFNRSSDDYLAPSVKARWEWKLRIFNWLKKMFPVTSVIIEDIKAKCKGMRRWDKSFSPLEVGKKWFYSQFSQLVTKPGWETKNLRDDLGLKKLSNKMSNKFEAHCVDSWVLANSVVGGHVAPDNRQVVCVVPLQFHRRQLHVANPISGGFRKPYGGTRSLGWKRGSIVRHIKRGVVYLGGTARGRLSVYCLKTGKRLALNIKKEDCRWLGYASFYSHGVSA